MTEDAHSSRRVFFAVWPDEQALDALEAAAAAGVERCGGQRMRRDSLHLTLAFIGAVSAAKIEVLLKVGASLNAVPFLLTLDRLGWWPHNRILWAGCHEAPSGQRRLFTLLAQALEEAGFRLDPRPHAPHVTLARRARCDALPELAMPVRWRVDDFTLVESFLQSSGARYRVLARWPLLEMQSG